VFFGKCLNNCNAMVNFLFLFILHVLMIIMKERKYLFQNIKAHSVSRVFILKISCFRSP
jgi:hypothetical protein